MKWCSSAQDSNPACVDFFGCPLAFFLLTCLFVVARFICLLLDHFDVLSLLERLADLTENMTFACFLPCVFLFCALFDCPVGRSVGLVGLVGSKDQPMDQTCN